MYVAVQVPLRREDVGPYQVTLQGCQTALLDYARGWTLALGPILGAACAEQQDEGDRADDWEAYGY